MELQKTESRSSAGEARVEVMVDVRDNSVAAQSGETAEEDTKLSIQAKFLAKKSSLDSMVRSASSRIKQVPERLKRLASPRGPPPAPLDPTKSAALHGLMGLRFISKKDGAAGWSKVEKNFDRLADSTNGLLNRSLFAECIDMKGSEEFARKLFDALARKRGIKGDSIEKAQLKEFWDQISDPSFDSRLQTFFDMVDRDADGKMTTEEIKEMISLSASANRLSKIKEKADEFASLIMEELDPNHHGYIMIEDLEMVLLASSKQAATGGSARNLSQQLSRSLKSTKSNHTLFIRWYQKSKYFLQDNWQKVWILALWIGVMLGLFAYKFVQYRNKAAYKVMGHCVCVAKGAAETLKLNMALILLPVCRNTLTWLRNKTKLSVAVPFDDNLDFHMVIAVAVAIGVGVHSVYHLACDFPRLIHASSDKFALLQSYFKEQPSNYWEFIKGVEGITGIVMVVLMSIAFTLASPRLRTSTKLTGFNAFWYCHHLFIIVYALLIVHGIYLYLAKEWYNKTTWMYLAVPVVLYGFERLTRAFRSNIETVDIKKVAFYPCGPRGVLALQMGKPKGFEYMSGQYIFVKCASVSPFEWHPFSLTSSPSDDYLGVHIRIVGDWTGHLKTVFQEACSPPNGNSGLLWSDSLPKEINQLPKFPKVMIDGPYGAPAQEYKKYEVVMLVGLGIGATPMISIVKDIYHNIKEKEKKEEEEGDKNMEEGNIRRKTKSKESVEDEFKTRRAYFYWVTREQESFSWFKGVMNEVGELDHKGVIELNNYCTSVYEEGDFRSALIEMIQFLNHAKNGVDIVSGTCVKSHFAKPDWPQVFHRIHRKHPNTSVGVFYCGPPGVAKVLRQLSLDMSHTTSTVFEFHKENF